MLKILRNFIIGLCIGSLLLAILLPYLIYQQTPRQFYSSAINHYFREEVNTKQLARFVIDGNTRVPILTYYYLLPNDTEWNGVTLDEFEQQIKTLKELGYTFITPNELASAIYKGKALPEKPILITFDDCYKSIIRDAFPILEKYEAKATINVIGYHVEHYYNYDNELLTWKDIKKMVESGLINLQSETYYSYSTLINFNGETIYPFVDHKDNEGDNAYLERITKDLEKNTNAIGKITDTPVVALAYPRGMYNDFSIPALQQANIKLGFDSNGTHANDLQAGVDAYHLSRYTINAHYTTKDFIHLINTDAS